jgi:hypothetical protein
MAKNQTKTVKMTGKLQYARFFEDNRDMGNPEQGIDYADTDGLYKATLLVTEEEMNNAVSQGLPARQGAFDMFKPVEDGLFRYNLKRPHLHKHFMQLDEDGNQTSERLVVGPPFVFDLKAFGDAYKADQSVKPTDFAWDDRLIGNDTFATVKLSVRTGTSAKGKVFQTVQLEQVGIIDLVVYERNEADEWAA